MKKLNLVFLFLLLTLVAAPAAADTLWLGNDHAGDLAVRATTTTGAVVATIPQVPTTGIAWDGSSLYFVDRAGNFTRRSADGATVLGSFLVPSFDTGEDLAWDSSRNVLWRIVHTNRLQKIDPVTGTEVAFTTLPNTDTVMGPLGGLGIAYDSRRDLLYVSYCQQGCTGLVKGLVQVVDPNTLTVSSNLFYTDFYAGGLGYDAIGDTLWIGGSGLVRNVSLTGTVLSSFALPAGQGFPDGLELVQPVPEPATMLLLATGGLGFLSRLRKRK